MSDEPVLPVFSGDSPVPGAPLSDAPEMETRQCPDCGEAITGKASGRGSVAWLMGTHRRNKHGVAGNGKAGRPKAAKPGAPTQDDFATAPVLSVVRAAAAEVGGRGTKRVPTESDLAKAGGQAVALTAIAVASFMVETDPAIPEGPEGEQLRSELVDYLSLDQDSATNVMRPIGRAFAGTKTNQKYGRQIVDNVDVLSSFADLAMLGMHWRRYMRMRSQPAAQQRALYAVPDITPMAGPVEGMATPAPQAGHVISAEDVARMQSTQ